MLYKIKEGQNMTLLGQEGRWLKVRVGGRTGYVPRSKVEMSDNEELARRAADWTQPEPRYVTGVFAKYAAAVGSASEGAITR